MARSHLWRSLDWGSVNGAAGFANRFMGQCGICGVPLGNSADDPFLATNLAAWITDFPGWETKQKYISVWIYRLLKIIPPPPPPSLFLLIWNGNKKKSRTNQPSHHPPPLPPKRKAKKILSDKPFHLTWYRIVHFRPLWEKWWNANLKEQSCGRMLCLNDLFVLTYEHRVQNVKVANTPFPSPPLRFELNYLTSWETDHPDSHITEDLGGGESARSFSCCHCSA